MLKTIVKLGAFMACIILFTFCSKEETVDFSMAFSCTSPASICSKPDSIGVVFGGMDCDNGGISNYHECIAGTSFTDGSDDCTAAMRAKVDLCLLISEENSEAAKILRDQDCDGGGFSNFEECMMGFDPLRGNDQDELQSYSDDTEIKIFLEKNNIISDTLALQDTIGIIATSYEMDSNTFDVYRAETGIIYFVESNASGLLPVEEDTIVYDFTSSYLSDCVSITGINVAETSSSCSTIVHTSAMGDTTLMSSIVKGFRQGLTQMPIDTKGRVIVPSRRAYNQESIEGLPPYSVLVFDVEIKAIL